MDVICCFVTSDHLQISKASFSEIFLRCRSIFLVELSQIPCKILSLINESLIQSQKLHDCNRSFRAEMYNSTLSSGFRSRLLKTYLSYVSFVSPMVYLSNFSMIVRKSSLSSAISLPGPAGANSSPL